MTNPIPPTPQDAKPGRVARVKAWWQARSRTQKILIGLGVIFLLLLTQCGKSSDGTPAAVTKTTTATTTVTVTAAPDAPPAEPSPSPSPVATPPVEDAPPAMDESKPKEKAKEKGKEDKRKNDKDHVNDMDRFAAAALCKQQAALRANYPDSVKWERYNKNEDLTIVDDGQAWQVDLTMKAKNAFGMEDKHEVRCFVTPDDKESGTVRTLIDEEIIAAVLEDAAASDTSQ
ncbi:hypothetical protein C1Y63_10390 [Corynebacterium sp. 13CS0277]|uniref:hypothetical protein n=1 Tax=Corynebacterium sp. 13CS0277 TaxID=2071994 RepID=UPI000D03FD26|nr:hypothetical protein [Corynebacterium sp. 13CS0277]PRQ10597.1 hypothetical protein C1Y63_10390 [Corynebacterium sp. 13CS0277]